MSTIPIYPPNTGRHCLGCHMRLDRCACPRRKLADPEDFAIDRTGKAEALIRAVWMQERACLRLKLDDPIRDGDRIWQVAVAVDKSIVDSFGGEHTPEFRHWLTGVRQVTPPMWHPVPRKFIGQTRRQLGITNPIGRPRARWEYLKKTIP